MNKYISLTENNTTSHDMHHTLNTFNTVKIRGSQKSTYQRHPELHSVVRSITREDVIFTAVLHT